MPGYASRSFAVSAVFSWLLPAYFAVCNSDVNECATNNGRCDPLSACTNTLGNRTCSPCPSGYSGSGYTTCTGEHWSQQNALDDSRLMLGRLLASDVNECLTDNGGCDWHVTCQNTPGSRVCGACPTGYTGNGNLAHGCAGVVS